MKNKLNYGIKLIKILKILIYHLTIHNKLFNIYKISNHKCYVLSLNIIKDVKNLKYKISKLFKLLVTVHLVRFNYVNLKIKN